MEGCGYCWVAMYFLFGRLEGSQLKMIASGSLVLLILTTSAAAQQYIPSPEFTFSPSTSVNGSSPSGKCTSHRGVSSSVDCRAPNTSVLFDGHIPTLTGLDGDLWASELLTLTVRFDVLNRPLARRMTFDFSQTPNFTEVKRAEVVLFNCEQWEISLKTITSQHGSYSRASTAIPSSCNSLVRTCIPDINTITVTLHFIPINPTDWIHIAEVIFYGDNSTCPPPSILSSTEENEENISADSTSPVLTAVILATIALLSAATLIAVVLIVTCKCYHKTLLEGTTESNGKGESQQIKVEVTMSDPIYMEIDEIEADALKLKSNEAYCSPFAVNMNGAYNSTPSVNQNDTCDTQNQSPFAVNMNGAYGSVLSVNQNGTRDTSPVMITKNDVFNSPFAVNVNKAYGSALSVNQNETCDTSSLTITPNETFNNSPFAVSANKAYGSALSINHNDDCSIMDSQTAAYDSEACSSPFTVSVNKAYDSAHFINQDEVTQSKANSNIPSVNCNEDRSSVFVNGGNNRNSLSVNQKEDEFSVTLLDINEKQRSNEAAQP